MALIHPVILKVPESERQRKGRDLVIFLSRHARNALTISARKYGVSLPPGWPAKNDSGVPMPLDGLFWSITHKPEFVAAVAGPEPVGIDIEKIRPFREGLQDKVAAPDEWSLCGGFLPEQLFRYWTAKEAVLKAVGEGLKGLSRCRVVHIVDDRHLEIDFRNRRWSVEHFYCEDHVASVTVGDAAVEWGIGDMDATPR
ncbi:MAG: 4'-phosphopantetheinyl transferase family protein [Thermodesulfobacteriota bacterium]